VRYCSMNEEAAAMEAAGAVVVASAAVFWKG